MEMEKTIRQDDGKNRVRLVLSGDVVVANALELRTTLLSVLAEGEAVEVVLTGAERVDLTLYQLLCAAHHTATKDGKSFTVEAGANENFRRALDQLGLPRHVGCARDKGQNCLWSGGAIL